MQSPDIEVDDKVLYSVHESLRFHKPHLGNPLGERLVAYTGLTHSETRHFPQFFSQAILGNASIGLAEQMVIRYAWMRNRVMEVIDSLAKEESEEKHSGVL